MLHSMLVVLADVPNISPNLNFPGAEKARVGISILMGGIVLLCVVMFLVGVAQLAARIGNDKSGGYVGPVMRMGISVIAIGIIFSGTSFLDSWVQLFNK